MSSSAITTQIAQLKVGNVQNQADSTSIYSNGVWSFKNSTALTSVTISDAGNVGIGTASPACQLEINNGTSVAEVRIGDTAGRDLVLRGGTSSTELQIGSSDSRAVTFIASNTERMRIDASGVLFIGKSSSAGTMPGNHFGSLNNGTGGAAYNETVSTDTQNLAVWYINRQSLDGSIFEFRRNNIKKGSITINSTNVVYNTSPSDYRLKEQVQDLSGGLEKVKQLRPVSFKWKESGKEDFGFIAHEIASVIPECVTGDKDAVDAEGKPEYQSIFPAPAQMIASLVSAIQEQQAMIEELKAKVSALESK